MDIGKLLLLGAAGYIAYEYFLAPAATPTAASAPGGIQPAPTPPIQQTAPGSNPTTTKSLVLAITNAQKPPFTQGTADEWDYYYTQARGISAPDPGTYLTADQRPEVLTFDEWWSLASAHGLSGYRRA